MQFIREARRSIENGFSFSFKANSAAISHNQHSSKRIASTGSSYIKRHLHRSNDNINPLCDPVESPPIQLVHFGPIQGHNYTVTSTKCSICALLLFVGVLQWSTRFTRHWKAVAMRAGSPNDAAEVAGMRQGVHLIEAGCPSNRSRPESSGTTRL